MPHSAERVVITGMGAVSCLGRGVAPMWRGLIEARSGIGPLTRLKLAGQRIVHAGEVPALGMPIAECRLPNADLATAYAFAAVAEALNQAGLAERETVGLVMATNFGAMSETERLLAGAAQPPSAVTSANSSQARAPVPHTAAFAEGPTAAVAAALRLGGAQSTLSLSCASGNAAIGYAADRIRSGRAAAVVACGYDAISEVVWAGLSSLRAMSAQAIRPFDRRRDGTIFSEGAGALVLEGEAHALARGAKPLAEFLGCATSSNAFHMTHPDPDGAGMVRAMRGALRDAGLAPEEVDHINAHATGTPSNDKLETAAIKTVFGARAAAIPINGIKAMLGHAMGAASALEAIATVLTIREGVIPPTINLEVPDPDCDLDYTPLKARRVTVKTAMSNAAGFGGCNATVIFREYRRR